MLFSIPWSIGAVTDPDGREKIDQYYRNILAGKNEDLPMPKSMGKLDVPMPDTGLVYDYVYEVSNKTILDRIQQNLVSNEMFHVECYKFMSHLYSEKLVANGNTGMISSKDHQCLSLPRSRISWSRQWILCDTPTLWTSVFVMRGTEIPFHILNWKSV